MKALILAAGYGTRLYPYTKNCPKPLLEVNKRPLIEYLIDKLAVIEDLNEIVIVTNNKFYAHFVQWRQNVSLKHRIVIVNDMTSSPEDKLGALGDMDMVIKFKGDDDYLVLGGDNFYQDSLAGFVQGAKEKSPFVSIGVSDIHDRKKARSYGVVDLDDTSRITRFEEKPPVPHSSFVAMCLYYFPREKIPLFKEYFSNPLHSRDAMGMFIQWLVSQDRVFGFLFEHLWADIGQLEAYRHLQETLARGE